MQETTIYYGGEVWTVGYEVIDRESINLHSIALDGGKDVSQFMDDIHINNIQAAVEAHLKSENNEIAVSNAMQRRAELAIH